MIQERCSLTNRCIGVLAEGIAPELLVEPMNVLRAALHPDGMARRVVNLDQWRAHLLERLRRQVTFTGSTQTGRRIMAVA